MPYDPKDEAAATARGVRQSVLEVIQATRGLTNNDVAEMPEGKLRGLLFKLDIPDRPRLRAEFLRLQQVDESGQIPRGARQTALRQLRSMRRRVGTARGSVAGVPCGRKVVPAALAGPPVLPAGAGIGAGAAAAWVPLGPGNIGGRTRAIVVHPTVPDTIWVASAGGGVWRTTDAGLSWSPVDDRMANLAATCLAMDPTKPDVIYAGTGEGFNNVDALRGAGVFQTRDGLTWSQITATRTYEYVNRLAVSPDGKLLLAATRQGVFRSQDAARATWTAVLSGVDVADVKFHPTDPKRAVAGGTRNGTAYYSSDGGKTWASASSATPWNGRVELAYAVKDPLTVYASVEMDTGEVWRSRDGGKTYTRRKTLNSDGGGPANYLGDQGWYDNAIWAGDPKNANLVLVGGIDLWRSTDGGNKLTRISDWRSDKSPHSDHHAIVSHPGYDGAANKIVFFGNDGGVYRADDVSTAGGGPKKEQGWTSLVNGYAVTQFFGGAGNPATGTIIGGAQDNGTLAYTPAAGANGWKEILGGDGGYVAADPTDPNIFYTEYVYLDVYRNDDGATSSGQFWEKYISGRFWNQALNGGQGDWDWKALPYHIPDARLNQALFIAPFVLDPNEPQRLLAGGRSLWRTDDAKSPNTDTKGPSWRSIKPPAGGSPISAIAVARGDSKNVWVGHQDGTVYRSSNATAAAPSWTFVSNTGPKPLPAGRFCTRIVIDPSKHKVVYVMFGGYTAQNLWKTSDGGATWADIGSKLPAAPVRSLAIHPRKSDFLYAGSEVGVFTSEDGGVKWSPTNEGPTNCAVFEFFWMNETLVCVTHGRGMFQIDLTGA